MYPLGHLALGYFSARIVHHFKSGDYNIFLVWAISISPDLDILIPFLFHRGPTHSITAILVVVIPIFLMKKEWLPYAASFASHALLGDIITWSVRMRGSMLLWPISSSFYGFGILRMGSVTELSIEFTLFIIMIILIWFELASDSK
jgi:membrane-bound metal-dependent hydrolase YbcI (DUF457 family)